MPTRERAQRAKAQAETPAAADPVATDAAQAEAAQTEAPDGALVDVTMELAEKGAQGQDAPPALPEPTVPGSPADRPAPLKGDVLRQTNDAAIDGNDVFGPAYQHTLNQVDLDRGYYRTTWNKLTVFNCVVVGCAFDTMDPDAIAEHVYTRHPYRDGAIDPLMGRATVDRFGNIVTRE